MQNLWLSFILEYKARMQLGSLAYPIQSFYRDSIYLQIKHAEDVQRVGAIEWDRDEEKGEREKDANAVLLRQFSKNVLPDYTYAVIIYFCVAFCTHAFIGCIWDRTPMFLSMQIPFNFYCAVGVNAFFSFTWSCSFAESYTNALKYRFN